MVGEMTTALSPSMISIGVPRGKPQALTTAISICSVVEPGYQTTGLLGFVPSRPTKMRRRGMVTRRFAPSKSWLTCSTWKNWPCCSSKTWRC